jgi:hypothetical protein
MFTNTPIILSEFTNTFISSNNNVPILRSNQPDIGLAILIAVTILLLVKLFSMAYVLFYTEYNKYQYRKYMRMKEKVLTEDNLKKMYSEVRSKHNGTQLEFPFVKAIDDAYVAARYNLNEEEE